MHKRKWSFSVKRLDTGYWYPIFFCKKGYNAWKMTDDWWLFAGLYCNLLAVIAGLQQKNTRAGTISFSNRQKKGRKTCKKALVWNESAGKTGKNYYKSWSVAKYGCFDTFGEIRAHSLFCVVVKSFFHNISLCVILELSKRILEENKGETPRIGGCLESFQKLDK